VKLTIQLKGITPESTYEDKWKAMVMSAYFIQGLNKAMEPLFIHGPIKCNPDSKNIEGFLGDVNGYPNEVGVLDVVIENYDGLKIPSLPEECPFFLYFGDTSEQVPVLDEKGNEVLDEEGNPIFKTILSGAIAGD
jgi:hypothetical protein